MKKVIQVLSYEDDEIIHEVDVTGKSDQQIDRVENGMNINLNHNEYYTQVADIEDRPLIKSVR